MKLDKGRLEAAFNASTQSLETGNGDARLQELWTFLEPTLEDRGALEQEAREHVRENTKDIRSWRRGRTFATSFAVGVVLVAMFTLGWMLSGLPQATHLAELGDDSVRIAFLAGSFTTIFGLTALIVRGAFGPPRKEEGSMFVPENAKVIAEAFGSLMGHKG